MNVMNLLALTDAAAPVDPNATVDPAMAGASLGGSLLGMLIPIGAMILVFYFFIIRPERKKSKKVKEMLDSLKVGDRICTIGGFYATIAHVYEDRLEVTLGKDDVKVFIARWAVRNVEELTVENDSELLN